MKRSRILIYLVVLVASLSYLQTWIAADHAPGLTPSGEGLMAPLDDAYIFGQYARQALRGQFMHYTPAAPISTGVSSFSWLALLTVLMGLGLPLTWAAWLLGALCLSWTIHSLFRLNTRLFPSLPKWTLSLLFLVHASSVSLYFQGMDSGLLLAAMFAGAEAALDPQAKRKFWALALLLVFTRPEGQIALPLIALARAWDQGLRGRSKAFLLGIAMASLPTLAIWALSGSPIPDSVRPKTAAIERLSFGEHLQVSTLYASEVSGQLLMGWVPHNQTIGYVGNASAGNDPAKHFPPFTLVIAVLGLFYALRQKQRRPWWLAMLGIWLVTLITLSWTLPVGWHRHRYLGPLWPLVLLGLASLLNELHGHPNFIRRIALSGILTLWFIFGLWTWPWFLQKTYQSATHYAAANREAAFGLRLMHPPSSVVLEDAGLLAYYSGWETIDLLGVTDHRFAMAQSIGRDAVLKEFLNRRPLENNIIAVLHPDRTDSYSQFWAEPGPLKLERKLGGMGLYKFNWKLKKEKHLN